MKLTPELIGKFQVDSGMLALVDSASIIQSRELMDFLVTTAVEQACAKINFRDKFVTQDRWLPPVKLEGEARAMLVSSASEKSLCSAFRLRDATGKLKASLVMLEPIKLLPSLNQPGWNIGKPILLRGELVMIDPTYVLYGTCHAVYPTKQAFEQRSAPHEHQLPYALGGEYMAVSVGMAKNTPLFPFSYTEHGRIIAVLLADSNSRSLAVQAFDKEEVRAFYA